MLTVVLSLIVLVAVLLILVILAQNSKGGGLSSQFGGAGASNMIGVKKTGDLLSNLTWGLIIALIVLSLSTNLMNIQPQGGGTDEFIDRAQDQNVVPSLDLGDVEGGQEEATPTTTEEQPQQDDTDGGTLEGLDAGDDQE